jgi:hypothetical protein
MKNIIEKTVLGAALVLAVVVGPALSSAGPVNQRAAVIEAAAPDYSVLNPLNRDQLIAVIKCLTDGSGTSLGKCVVRVTQAPSLLDFTGTNTIMRSQNYRISPVDGVRGATLFEFGVTSHGGNSILKSVPVEVSVLVPSTLYLYDGTTLLSSKSGTSTVVFDNLNTTVLRDTTKILTIKADYPSTTVSGSRTRIDVWPGTFQSSNGQILTAGGLMMGGPLHFFFTSAASIKLVGTPTIISTIGTNPYLTATFPLAFQAIGNNVVMPTASDFTIRFTGISNYTATSSSPGISMSVVTIPMSNIADGSTANVTVTVSANRNALLTSGLYNAEITRIKWVAGSVTATQSWGLEDFKTPYAAQFNR